MAGGTEELFFWKIWPSAAPDVPRPCKNRSIAAPAMLLFWEIWPRAASDVPRPCKKRSIAASAMPLFWKIWPREASDVRLPCKKRSIAASAMPRTCKKRSIAAPVMGSVPAEPSADAATSDGASGRVARSPARGRERCKRIICGPTAQGWMGRFPAVLSRSHKSVTTFLKS